MAAHNQDTIAGLVSAGVIKNMREILPNFRPPWPHNSPDVQMSPNHIFRAGNSAARGSDRDGHGGGFGIQQFADKLGEVRRMVWLCEKGGIAEFGLVAQDFLAV